MSAIPIISEAADTVPPVSPVDVARVPALFGGCSSPRNQPACAGCGDSDGSRSEDWPGHTVAVRPGLFPPTRRLCRQVRSISEDGPDGSEALQSPAQTLVPNRQTTLQPLAPAVTAPTRGLLSSGRPEPVNKIAAGLTMATAPPGVAGLAHQGKNFDYVHLSTELPGQGDIGSGLQRHRRLGALA